MLFSLANTAVLCHETETSRVKLLFQCGPLSVLTCFSGSLSWISILIFPALGCKLGKTHCTLTSTGCFQSDGSMLCDARCQLACRLSFCFSLCSRQVRCPSMLPSSWMAIAVMPRSVMWRGSKDIHRALISWHRWEEFLLPLSCVLKVGDVFANCLCLLLYWCIMFLLFSD